MKRKMIWGGTDREQSHMILEVVRRKEGEESTACCVEDPNDLDKPFQVWNSPPPPNS